MSRLSVTVVCLSALLAVCLAAMYLPAQAPKEVNRPENVFDTPVVIFGKHRDVSATVARAEIRDLGGRKFIVGTEVRNSPYTQERFSGGTIWIPLDDVGQLVQVPNPGK